MNSPAQRSLARRNRHGFVDQGRAEPTLCGLVMLRGIAALALVAAIASAQGQSVLDLARKAPPEIFADTAIKLVERGEVPAGDREKLLEEAFQAAKQAREPVRLTALPGVRSDTRAALRDSAGALGLDALSLQNRVIGMMAKTDAARARELFQSLEHPSLEARPCEDPMIADVSAYYETAASLLSKGAVPSDLMLALGQARSPGELANFAKALSAVPELPLENLRLLAGALALKMGMVAADYRSFTMTADELRSGLERLVAQTGEPTPLAEGVRKLILAQMSSPRCNEEFGDAVRFIEWFNGSRANRGFRGALPAIEDEELQPPRALGFFKVESYFVSGDAKQIADDFGRLRIAPDMLADFLREFSAWKPAGSNIDAFHQKMTVLHGLFQLIPPGDDRDALISRAVEYLKSSGVESEYPAEWLLQLRSFASSATGDRAKLLAALRESGDAGLAVFAALESVSGAVLQR